MSDTGGTIVVSPLMDSREIAAYLKVSESTLSRWRSAGQGPPFLRLHRRRRQYRRPLRLLRLQRQKLRLLLPLHPLPLTSLRISP